LTQQQRREPPRDDEEAAAFKGLGQAVTLMREGKGMDREEFAAKAEMTPTELRGSREDRGLGQEALARKVGATQTTCLSVPLRPPGQGQELG